MRKNFHHTQTDDHKRARNLRRNASQYEQRLWAALRENSETSQLKFRRQQPIHPYIADFVCMKARLIIELDGESHDSRQVYDAKRDEYLQAQGYTVLRIANDEIAQNLAGVVETILMRAKALS